MSGEEYHYTQPVRHTRMGGITRPVAVCDACGLVEPHATRSSKSGTHGEWFYSHPHQSSVAFTEIPERELRVNLCVCCIHNHLTLFTLLHSKKSHKGN
jgi:hypothetical protein